jgi:uncharacterized protein involved in outer membrane biogenesis
LEPHQTALNAKVSEELHRPFAINGNLAVVAREPDEGGWRAWVPWPHVIAEDLTLGNPDWSKQAADGHPEKGRAAHFALALLVQRVVIPRIDLTEPSASCSAWPMAAPTGPSLRPQGPECRTVQLGGGHRRHRLRQRPRQLDDQTLKTRLDVMIDPLGKPIPVQRNRRRCRCEEGPGKGPPQDYAFGLKVKGQYHGQSLDGSGKIGGLLALQDAASRSRCRPRSRSPTPASPWPAP